MQNEKSASEIIFNILKDRGVGFTFTTHNLIQIMNQTEYKLSDGSISGFINRGVRLNRISVVNRTKSKSSSKTVFIYKIIDITPWKFTKKGKGSTAGRHLVFKNSNKNTLLEFMEPEKKMEPENKNVTLSDQLINLAVEISKIENRKEKLLSDYSVEEIIQELTKRIK